MKNPFLASLLLPSLLGLGCQNASSHEVALSDVPQAAKDAAMAAVPGFVLAAAETETEDGVAAFCLEGRANGKEYEIEVTADGRVLEVESEEADDHEAEEEEDDDDEEEEEDD